MTGVAGGVTVWRRRDGIMSRRTPRSIVIATLDLGDPRVLTELALTVWDELERPARDDDLVRRVASRVALDVDRVHDEVIAIRESLCLAGVLSTR